MEGFGGFFNDPDFQRRMQEMSKVVRHYHLARWADQVAEQFGGIAAVPRRVKAQAAA